MLEKIYIARHGHRLNWVTFNWQSKTGLARDPPLAAFGETQAQELGDYFSSLPENERPTAIFSSPFYRCLQTAQPVSSALGLPIYVEHGELTDIFAIIVCLSRRPLPGLAEWFSPVVPGTGLHPRPGSAESLKQYFTAIDPSWSSVWYVSRKGEDVKQIHDRTDGFLEAFGVEIERKFPGKHTRVLLVSHAATIITLVRSLLGDRDFPIRVGCCSLSEFERIPGKRHTTGNWKALRLADGSHLKDGASRDWGFEDIEISGGKVINAPGVPGSELSNEKDEPIGSQIHISSNL